MSQRQFQRGDIVRIDYEATPHKAIKKIRPAVVVQNDMGNRMAPYTIVAAIRENAGKGLPVLVPIPKGIGGLYKDSVVDCGNIATVRRERVGPIVGRLPRSYVDQVDAALRISLGLPY